MGRVVGYAYFFCIMMPFVIYLGIFEGMWPLLVVYTPLFVLSVFLVYRHMQSMKARGKMTKASEFLRFIEDLELDDLPSKFQNVLLFTDSSGRMTSRHIGIDESESVELINLMLALLENGNNEIKKLMENYLSFRPTDTKRYKYAGIVFYSYLLNNRNEDFVSTYKEFKDTLMSRTEYRVMGRMPGEIKLFDGKIVLDFDFLDLMYSHYGQGEDVFDKVMTHKINNNYHKVLITIIMEKYIKNTERDSVMTDYQEDFSWAAEFRNTYKSSKIWKKDVDAE